MFDSESVRHLLDSVAAGKLSSEQALLKLQQLDSGAFDPEPAEAGRVEDFARIDHYRADRTGFPEVIWGQDKSASQIAQIMKVQRDRRTSPHAIMATRVSPEVYADIQTHILGTQYFSLARICALPSAPVSQPRLGTLGILTAGTSDLPVAEEAAVTAELSGFRVERLWDVGVAGIHRLLDNREVLARADVLIVVAGMEGALPSVVGGMAQCPVIAVPTSIGYGASFGGLAALLGMLNSCAAGVGVVNIDNGFGAAILAGQILRTAARLRGRGLE
ncbi:MAG: nickel pincer cofactor biosynthesis protein LarB [Synechococcales cyanobacterium CRU_2_2]|nr:nickel pincer cofactor biosynthesis protein LarB [Synechococcales cyanobacterium CRU_2_2]